MRRMPSFLATVSLSLFASACRTGLSGHTYHNNGGVVVVEFKSGGKADISVGDFSQTCGYSETGKTVRMACKDGTFIFTIQDDGALVGPSNGRMARLTPVLH